MCIPLPIYVPSPYCRDGNPIGFQRKVNSDNAIGMPGNKNDDQYLIFIANLSNLALKAINVINASNPIFTAYVLKNIRDTI
jgi:hypothetical protein